MANQSGLYRSRFNSIFGGVAGGIAEYLNIDPLIIRLLFVLMALWGGGILLYIILWIVLPLEEFSPEKLKYMENEPKNFTEGKPEKEHPQKPWEKSRNDGNLIAGLILIALGIIFLIIRFVPRIEFGDLWPVILLVAGIALIWSSITKSKKH